MMLLCGVATTNEAFVCEAPVVFAPNWRKFAAAPGIPVSDDVELEQRLHFRVQRA